MKRNLIVGGLVGAVAVALLAAPAQARVSASQKGSLLIYSKVEIRWDAAGNLIQDTFIDLTNDFPEDVCVQMYFIQGDEYLPANFTTVGERQHLGCNNSDVGLCLTQNQPTYWSAATGYAGPDGDPVSPFTILDPQNGGLPGRPDYIEGSSDRILRGYIILWAVDNLGREIRWNHLKGDAVIVNYQDGTAWEYTAWAFASVVNADVAPAAGGDADVLFDAAGEVHPQPGFLQIGPVVAGNETYPGCSECGATGGAVAAGAAIQDYEDAFELLLLDFYATGSAAFTSGSSTVSIDTDLTLHPVSADLRQEDDGPVTTKATVTVWNQNETKFTGMDRCIECWDQVLLSLFTLDTNHFLEGNLHTDKGKAQIASNASQLCDLDYDPGDECTQDDLDPATPGDGNDGVDEDCDPRDIESTDDPLLGVVAKHLYFSSGDRAVAGMNLIGLGVDSASIQADLVGGGGTPPERPEDGGVIAPAPSRFPVSSATR